MLQPKKYIILQTLQLGDFIMKSIKTNKAQYEIHSLYEGRKNTSAFSCDNKCMSCETVCDIGIIYRQLIHKEVGA